MFKLSVRKELVKYGSADETGTWVERRSLVRDDGVRLESRGSGPEREGHFRYTDGKLSIDVTARRYDVNLSPTDTWQVELGPALKKYSSLQQTELSLGEVQLIARNLQDALMAWPRPASDPDIRHVKFLMKFWPAWNPAWGDWVMNVAESWPR
jgi:hypothetical protein